MEDKIVWLDCEGLRWKVAVREEFREGMTKRELNRLIHQLRGHELFSIPASEDCSEVEILLGYDRPELVWRDRAGRFTPGYSCPDYAGSLDAMRLAEEELAVNDCVVYLAAVNRRRYLDRVHGATTGVEALLGTSRQRAEVYAEQPWGTE